MRGEVLGTELAPGRFTTEDGILGSSTGLRVLDQGLVLGSSMQAHGGGVKFVSVTEEDLESARDIVAEEDVQLLPLDMRARSVVLQDPKGSGCWLAVYCPDGYLQKIEFDKIKLQMPRNLVPHAQIPRTSVTIATATACCGLPLGQVLIHSNGRRVGITDSNGSLRLALPPGIHVLTAPNQSKEQVTVTVDPSFQEEQVVELTVDGGLFLFQQDMSLDEDKKFGIKLCTNPYSIPTEATPFVGEIQLQDSKASSADIIPGAGKGFRPLLSVGKGVKCGEVLQALKVKPTVAKGTQRWELNPDADEWFEEMKDECMVSLLFSGTPLPIGYLIGGMPAQPFSLKVEHTLSATTKRGSTTRQRSIGGSRRSAYPGGRAACADQRCKTAAVACRASSALCVPRGLSGHSDFLDFLGIRPVCRK